MTNKEELFKMIKKMTPGDVMTFVAQELGVNPAELLAKNAGSIALKAVKAGWAKAGDIKDAVKGFSAKTKADDTGIDWDGIEIEEAGFKMSCLFDGDSGKKLKEFVKKLGDQMKSFAKEEKKVNESKFLIEAKTFKDVISKEALDALVKAAKEGVKIPTPSGKRFTYQTGQMFAQNFLRWKFPDDYKKINKAFGAVQQNKIWNKLSDVDFAARIGNESELKSALKIVGNVRAKDTIENAVDSVTSKALSDTKSPKEAVAAAGASKDAAKEMANDEELKKQTAEKAGVKAFTPLGWARLAAKTTGYVLNHGKDVVDALGAKKIAKSEDMNVIAEIRTQIENAESSDKDYSDSEFSIRFTVDDFKWHATCIDDRKMQVPEDVLVKKVLSTDTGKKFKAYCLKKWKSMFWANSDGDYAMLPFMLGNIDKFGLKSGNNEFFKKVKTVADNMDKIEQQFK